MRPPAPYLVALAIPTGLVGASTLSQRPFYGVDFPSELQSPFLGASFAAVLAASAHKYRFWGPTGIRIAGSFSILCSAVLVRRMYYNIVERHHNAQMVGDLVQGDTLVMGCKNGLALATAGKAMLQRGDGGSLLGIDRWDSVECSYNSKDAARSNLKLEDPRLDRVQLQTVYFPEDTGLPSSEYDTVVSHHVLSNALYGSTTPFARARRQEILAEMRRVLRAGGRLILWEKASLVQEMNTHGSRSLIDGEDCILVFDSNKA